jgi:transcriptional regulator with XRE-family HTH domain
MHSNRLLYFRSHAMNQHDIQQDADTELGELLRDLRVRRGYSVKKLARLAGVARKTIDNAERGLNISVLVLKRLLRALGADSLTISVSAMPTAHTVRLTPEAVAGVLLEMRDALAVASGAVERLESMNSGYLIDDDLAREAEDLIKDFSTFVHSVDSPEQLALLRQTVNGVVAPNRRKVKSTQPLRRRRRTA